MLFILVYFSLHLWELRASSDILCLTVCCYLYGTCKYVCTGLPCILFPACFPGSLNVQGHLLLFTCLLCLPTIFSSVRAVGLAVAAYRLQPILLLLCSVHAPATITSAAVCCLLLHALWEVCKLLMPCQFSQIHALVQSILHCNQWHLFWHQAKNRVLLKRSSVIILSLGIWVFCILSLISWFALLCLCLSQLEILSHYLCAGLQYSKIQGTITMA